MKAMSSRNPTFVIYTGPMFGTKTSRLLSALDRYKYQSKDIVAFKPLVDVRYSNDHIVTHNGWKFPATAVSTGTELLAHLANLDQEPHVVAVDEAFMIPGVADALIWLYKDVGLDVVVSSLELSAQGKPFHEIKEMMPWATEVVKCASVCAVCGRDAPYTHKKEVNEDEIQVGGSEIYEPRCWCCSPLMGGK